MDLLAFFTELIDVANTWDMDEDDLSTAVYDEDTGAGNVLSLALGSEE